MENFKKEVLSLREIFSSTLINSDGINTYFGSFRNCSWLFYMQYGNISSWDFVVLYVNSSLNTHKYVGISDSFST